MVKVSQMIYNHDSKRYELDGDDLHCGDCIEVLIFNALSEKAEWIETRIEYNGEAWYLVGLAGYEIGGLFAKR